eukprot:TRINITY_DN5710_c0_g3_i1.p1 TRINITY_DN5710_c0_g3~~TRINITY_DN5710_c0_g3_i1.p1  ORF type:complete len:609 (+),score=222.74 TRINITY_DN5710_c0_g3_i1:114-1940(+)
MDEALGGLPKVFTRTPGDLVVLAKTTTDSALGLSATDPSGAAYFGRFDESALKQRGMSNPKQFLDSLTEAFNGNGCKSSGGGDKVALEVPGCGSYELVKQSQEGHALMMEAIMSFTKLRVSKDPDKQLEDAARKAMDAQQRAKALESEEKSLQETIKSCKEKTEHNLKRLEQLQQELQVLEEEKRKEADGGAAPEPEEEPDDDEDDPISRVRNPLGARDCKEVDFDLLRLVKGRYMDIPDGGMPVWDPQAPQHRYCNVVKPYTSSEFAKAVAGLGEGTAKLVFDLLDKLDLWDYDVFGMQAAMAGAYTHAGLATQPQGGSLFVTTYALMHRYGFMKKFNLNERTVINWCSLVESGYHPNPYHNSMHAADVLHITHYILSPGGLISTCKLSDEDVFAAVVAATIHDYNHPGINNNFHIKVQTYLATVFNDRSILENIHVSSVFELMKMDKFNILEALTDDQRRDVRETIVEMVLATDMGLHAKILGTFKRRLAEDHDFKKKDDIRLALSMAVKMADISNCGRPQKLYLLWCNQIADEFYMQGDRERNLGFPCSPFMDRYQPAMAKGQIAFMNYIVVPLFECISEFLPEMHFSVDYTEENKAYWASNDDS